MPGRLTAVDLFCGAGGLSCGLEQAGVEVLAGLDANPVAHLTHALHHPRAAALGTVDLATFTGTEILGAIDVREGELDVVVGGPPCQGFSTAGNRQATDVRNTLVFHFARLVREMQPRFFVMENVVGLLSMRDRDGRRVLEALAEELESAGYRTNVPAPAARATELVVNAADHGVPQRRRRILIFGARERSDALPRLVPTHHDPRTLPLGGATRPHVTVSEALDDLPDPVREEPIRLSSDAGLSEYARAIRDPEGLLWNHVPSRHKPFMVERMAAQAPGTPLYDTWAHAWVRLVADEPSPTVKENHNAPFVHHRQPRIVTPRECARLQSFPDSFRFEGPKSKQLVQIGNAVPPLLGAAIGRALLAAAHRAPAQAVSPAG